MKGRSLLLRSGLAGVVLLIAAPPTNVAACVWIALAWLASLLDADVARTKPASRVRRATAGIGRGLAFGMAANLVAFRFMPGVVTHFTTLGTGTGVAATVLLAFLHAVRWGLCGWVHVQLVERGVASPLAFAAAVYISTFVPAMIPWMPADGATSWLSVMQLGEVIGERGVQALIALVAALLACAWREAAGNARRPQREGSAGRHASWRRALLLLGGALGLHGAMALEGRARIASIEAHLETLPHVKVALVAPDLPAVLRWQDEDAGKVLVRLTDLTRAAEASGAAFTVWPETAYPFPLDRAEPRLPTGNTAPLGEGVRGPVLSGVIERAPNGDVSNAATVFDASGATGPIYDKMHLLWFGETVPLAEQLPWMKRTFFRGYGLAAGAAQVALPVSLDGARTVRTAVLNCFEDTLPSSGREAMAVHPEVIVNLTNDVWFLGSAESELHLNMAQMRAIETRRDMVRAVNYGKTSWIDAAGRVRVQSDDWQPGYLLAEPALSDDAPSPYTRFGDVPFALILTLGLFASGVTRRKHGPAVAV